VINSNLSPILTI